MRSSNLVLALPNGVSGCGARATEIDPFCCVKMVDAAEAGVEFDEDALAVDDDELDAFPGTTRPSENENRCWGCVGCLKRYGVTGLPVGRIILDVVVILFAAVGRIENCARCIANAFAIDGLGEA